MRITYDIYNLLTWAFLDGNSAAHHVMRWILKGGVVCSTFGILRLVAPVRQPIGLPFWAFCVVYIFFPNNPEARLAPVELLTVIFLALLLYEIGRLFVRARADLKALGYGRYLWLVFIFTAVLWCKETNIVFGAVTLMMFLCLGPKQWARVAPFFVIFLVTAVRVWMGSQSGGYGTAPITWELIRDNNAWCLRSLFLWQTSWIITLLLAVPLLTGVCCLAGRTYHTLRAEAGGVRENIGCLANNPIVIICWLILLYAAAFYAIFLTSWGQTIRYFYPLVYLLALWIGITLLLLENILSRRRWVTGALAMFCAVYFIGANYYNFTYQYACQYYTRIVEREVLQSLDRLLRDGRAVNLAIESEYECKIMDYFNAYLPYYKETTYRVTAVAVAIPGTDYRVTPDADINKPGSYYISKHETPPSPAHRLVKRFDHRHVSRMLRFCDRVSSWFQFGRPAFYWLDAGAPLIGRHGEHIQCWYLYICGDLGLLISQPKSCYEISTGCQ